MLVPHMAKLLVELIESDDAPTVHVEEETNPLGRSKAYELF
jgi:hypothetical protein